MALQTDTVTLKSALPTTTFETSKELLRYPLKEDDAYAGRIRFEVFTATPIDPTVDAAKIRAGSVAASKNKQIAIVEGSPTEEGAFDYYADQRRQLQLNQATVQFGAEFGSAEAIEERKQLEDAIAEVRAANNSLFKGFSYDKDLESSVVDLHFPLAVIFNDNINYSDASIGVIGASATAQHYEEKTENNAEDRGLAAMLVSLGQGGIELASEAVTRGLFKGSNILLPKNVQKQF